MLDEFKKSILLEMLQDELTGIQRGEKVYGNAQDQADAVEAIREMTDELLRTGQLGYEDPDAPLVVNLGG